MRFVLALLAAGALTARAQDSTAAARPSFRAGTSREAIQLDGDMREAAWHSVDSITTLTQVEPVQGGVPRARTVVRVLVTADALIVGVRADNAPGTSLVSFARNRDADLSNEDNVKVVLDTYLDGRSGYVFAVNPAGARYDALVANRGEGEDSNWDAVWDAATMRTAEGWSAEIRIPLKSILFRRGLTTWGLNVQRRIQRLQETDRWAGAAQNLKVTHVARAGRLTDLPPFELGVGLSVRPAVTARAGYAGPDTTLDRRGDLSLDATQRVGANSLASLTLNTDFAETEVDTRRTNLTRFALFFPEKRTFFLEGSDIFDFGLGLGESLRPFHSRSIGLLGSQRVPVRAGLKINGREGSTNFGALAVRTGDVSGLAPASTMGVVRVKQNVLSESSVGMIATLGDPQGRRRSWLAGSDATFQTSHFRGDKNLLVGVWGVAMDRDSLAGRNGAFGVSADYPNDVVDVFASYKWLGDGFLPSLGFVPRPGTQQFTLNANYQPRPRRPVFGLRVRQMFNELQTSLVTDLDSKWESYQVFMAPINWRLESGDRFEFNIVPTGERLTEAFEIADGVSITPGAYHFTRFRLEGGLASKRKFSGQYTWRFGPFYDGRLDQIQITSSWKPSALFIVELNAEHDIGRMPEGNFTKDLIGTRVRVNASPDLQVNSYVQYDNESHSFGTNTRLRWTFSPLGELFVVYNHNLSHDLVDGAVGRVDRRWAFASNQLLVKVQYAFRY